MSAPEPIEAETRRRFRLRELHSICDQFEQDWKAGGTPAIDQYLAGVAPEQRTELLSELLPLDVAFRRERQQPLPAEQYVALLPDMAEPVREILREQAALQDTASCADTKTPLGDRAKSKDPTVVRLGRFGTYELLSEIGRGGMGVVYKAHQPSLDRVVAIKTIVAGLSAPAIFVERFLTEARLAAKLNHPGIVPIYEIGQVDGQHYFSMEYVEGRTLAELVEQGGVSPLRAAGLVASVAEIVHFAHERGVLHRDLKPSNVIVGEAGRVRVMDFGLAKQIEGQTLTQAGEILGTPSFMPPEQARGEWSKVDRRSDVYSLGAVLYSLLTGRPPFKGESAMATIVDVIQCEPITPRQVRPDLDADVERICLKCLAKVPCARYATAAELMRELDDYVQGRAAKTASGVQPAPPPSPEPEPQPQPASAGGGSIPFWPIALGGGLLALLALAAVFFFQTPQGTLRVEINDPSIEVSVKGSDVVLKQRGKEEITLAPGAHSLIVKRGDFKFETSALVLKQGDSVTVKVDLVPGEVRVTTASGTPLGNAPLAGNAERVPKPRAVGRLLFKDDFDSPRPLTLPPVFGPGLMTWEYVKGRGQLTASVAGLVGVAYAEPLLKDFVAEYGFEAPEPPRGTSYGFFFRSELAAGGYPGYYVVLVHPAEQRIVVMCWQMSWTLMDSHPLPPGLLVAGRANDVRIEAVGSEFAVFLNGKFACRWTDNKLTKPGVFGFFTSGGAGEKSTVFFSKLRIYALPGDDPPAPANAPGGEAPAKVPAPGPGAQRPIAPFPGSEGPRPVLQFSGLKSAVELPLTLDNLEQPITIEGWLYNVPKEFRIHLPAGRDSLHLMRIGWSYWWLKGDQSIHASGIHAVSRTLPESWGHFAATYDAGTLQFFQDGKPVKASPQSPYMPEIIRAPSFIGYPFPTNKNKSDLGGTFGAMRISKVVRYREPFRPEPKLTSDENTLALYTLDAGEGDLLKDTSGNGRDGKIVNAKWIMVGREDQAAPRGPGAGK